MSDVDKDLEGPPIPEMYQQRVGALVLQGDIREALWLVSALHDHYGSVSELLIGDYKNTYDLFYTQGMKHTLQHLVDAQASSWLKISRTRKRSVGSARKASRP